MQLVSWNLRAGRATSSAVTLAQLLRADCLFVQESKLPVWPKAGLWTAAPGLAWGSAILVNSGELTAIPIPGFEGWVVGGRWTRSSGQGEDHVYVFSLHAPANGRTDVSGSYIAQCAAAVERIVAAVPPDAPLIIGGDFNCSLGERLQGEEVPSKQEEKRMLPRFRELGFTIAWRDLHAHMPLPQTLRWVGAPSKAFHCDGFLVRGRSVLAAVQCEVLTAASLQQHSDHFPVLLWLAQGSE